MSRIRMLLVDDHALFRSGLRVTLGLHDDFEIVGEAEDGAAAVELAGRLRPDVVLMDMRMPRMDGVEATRRIVANVPGVAVIGLTLIASEDAGRAMRAAGAIACMPKESRLDEVCGAIRQAASGRLSRGT